MFYKAIVGLTLYKATQPVEARQSLHGQKNTEKNITDVHFYISPLRCE